MPFQRPTLTELRTLVAQDIASALPGADPLLRFSNLQISGAAQAMLANLHYGYLDYIAQQAVPFTATDEFLEGWAALKDVYRLAATSASGQVTFTGTAGALIPDQSPLVRGDGVEYLSQGDATVGVGGSVVVDAIAVADPTGATGAFGNADAGTVLALGTAVAGINSSGSVTTAFTGGADLETDAALRTRMLRAYQGRPQSANADDYVTWALSVAGVTRAWCTPNGFGTGTVVVYIMLDVSEAAHGGFPQGSDGVAALEPRGVAATGDQLAVADYIFTLQPVTALVYAVAPVANTIAFTISGLSGASTATKNAVAAAIVNVFFVNGKPGGTILLSDIEAAITAVPGTSGFVITSPAGNITNTTGQLPVLGTITWA